jgi:hypothetical protein
MPLTQCPAFAPPFSKRWEAVESLWVELGVVSLIRESLWETLGGPKTSATPQSLSRQAYRGPRVERRGLQAI